MVFLKISQNLQENTCARVSFLIKMQTEAAKNTFIREHLQVTASVPLTSVSPGCS